MDKRLFDDVIGEVPPSTVDVEAVIARGRRADRVRRLASPAVAAGVAVVALTGVIAYAMGADGGSGAGAPPTNSAHPVAQCSRTGLESADEVKTRLTSVARTALAAQRPDLELAANPMEGFPEGEHAGPLEFYEPNPVGDPSICSEDTWFQATVATRGPEGDGTITITVAPDFFDDPATNCHPTGADRDRRCEQVSEPNGEIIVKRTLQSYGRKGYRVDIDRSDGTTVSINAATAKPEAASPNDAPPEGATPPLTLDQMVAIATDPALTMFP